MDFSSSPVVVAALIAASAALGAAFFAFVAALINAHIARRNAILQAVIAQRTKRAEFRQQWIQQLRESFSKVHAGIMAENADQVMAEHSLRILFMMNREDQDYERLKVAAQKIMEFSKKENTQEKINANATFVEVCQDILKREWKVVKDEISHFDPSLSVKRKSD